MLGAELSHFGADDGVDGVGGTLGRLLSFFGGFFVLVVDGLGACAEEGIIDDAARELEGKGDVDGDDGESHRFLRGTERGFAIVAWLAAPYMVCIYRDLRRRRINGKVEVAVVFSKCGVAKDANGISEIMPHSIPQQHRRFPVEVSRYIQYVPILRKKRLPNER